MLKRRVPVCFQTSAVDCGAACLTMIMRYYGVEIRVADLAQVCNVGRSGISAGALGRAAKEYGFIVHGRSLDLDDLRRVRLPVILQWEFRHWIVVERINDKVLEVIDPAVGRKRIAWNEVTLKMTGIVLLIEPVSPKKIPKRSSIVYLTKRLRSHKKSGVYFLVALLIVGLLTLLGQALGIVAAFASGFILSDRASTLALPNTNKLGAALVLLVCGKVLAEQTRSGVLVFVRSFLDSTLVLRLLAALLELPFGFFLARGAGELASRLQSYTLVRQLVTDQMASAAIDVMFIFTFGVALFKVSKGVSAIVGIACAVGVIIAVVRQTAERDLINAEIEAEAEKNRGLVELLRGAKRLKAGGQEKNVLGKWRGALNEQLNTSTRRNYRDVMWNCASQMVQGLVIPSVIWLEAYQTRKGGLHAKESLTAIFLVGGILAPVNSIILAAQQMRMASVYWERLGDIIHAPRERHGGVKADVYANIEFNNVTFTYPGEKRPALRAVKCSFPAGTTTAIVGVSGGGKSTFISLVLGLYRCQEGTIHVGTVDIDECDLNNHRKQIGVVLQDETIFEGSVLTNIRIGLPDADLGDVIWAAKQALIHEDILKMPAGYETFVSEEGKNLSGGQRQRLALARALVARPRLLLLDEAMANLDIISATALSAALDKLECTKIVISHRMASVVGADQIIVVENGTVCESGKHEELMKRQGVYWNMQIRAEASEALKIRSCEEASDLSSAGAIT